MFCPCNHEKPSLKLGYFTRIAEIFRNANRPNTSPNFKICFIKMAHKFVWNHIKLEICLFVMNFNSRGFPLRVLHCVVDTGYGLGRSLGDCRPALMKGQKYQMVKTQTEARSLNKPMADLGFLFLWVSPGDGWNLSHRPLGILRSSLALG